MLVATLVAVTATPVMTAPFGSVTVPVSVARMVCPATGPAAAVSTMAAPATASQRAVFMPESFAIADSCDVRRPAHAGSSIVSLCQGDHSATCHVLGATCG